MAYDDDDEINEDADRLRSHVSQLLVTFDAVRIFVSRTQPRDDGTETVSYDHGGGNWHAQVGQVREWLTVEDERVRQHVRVDE